MEGRGRSRRDYPSRSEEKSRSDRANNPPSRHLWVGNLSHSLTERTFAHHFLQFGELDSVAFQPARSYAFVNYRNEDDAFAAIKELQGFSLAGNPLRIEFAKAEKSLVSARDVHYSERRDDHPKGRGSPISQKDAREHRSSPETSHLKKSKVNDKDAEPSEVLWIGFPAQLRVDEFVLRKAFAPFGEIEKITTFPGRTYAFVRFRKVMSACRAKETLQGKLFGNPRVHICFAKSDSGPSNRERSSVNGPHSPHSGPYERSGSFDRFRSDRDFGIMVEDPGARSPYNLDPGEHNVVGRGRDSNLWSGGNDALEHRRYLGQGSERQIPGNIYEHPDSPPRNFGGRIHEFSPHKYSRQSAMYDDPWDLPEDVSLLRGTKKLKTATFPPENDLPEYPFSDLDKAKYAHLRDEKFYDSRNSGYGPIPERSTNRDRDDHWNAVRDDFQGGSMPLVPIDRRRLTPDRRESSSKEVWKWEGVLAKGGNPICRARCFPVGKPPDTVLPEYLDCTARTTLDMLSKHYYQAATACAVFFVPANDPDITYYNEFMSYLGEKQRAAVAKLDEMTTLFLVPPSEFSEKVLKVPGKLSISGVVLRLEPVPGSSYGSIPQYNNREAFQNDLPYQKPISPPGPYTIPPFSNDEKYVNLPAGGSAQGHDYGRNPTSALPPPPPLPVDHQYNASMPRTAQDAVHRTYTPDNSKFMPPNPSSTPFSNLPPEQVVQLASSLLGQQGTAGTAEYMPSGNVNQSGYPYNMPSNYELLNDQTQFNQMQQLQQYQQQQLAVQNSAVGAPQMAQPLQNPGQGQDDGESDPQKRLQATLQLAAALLQQIQQGKGS